MKIEEQVLSIEQMKYLQELGVDTSDASMFWVRAKRITGEQKNNCIDNDMGKWRLSLSKGIVLPAAWAVESVPTYTIGDLIEKLPKHIDSWNDNRIVIEGDEDVDYWYAVYKNRYEDAETEYFDSENLLTALYNLLCWVAETHKELLNKNNQE